MSTNNIRGNAARGDLHGRRVRTQSRPGRLWRGVGASQEAIAPKLIKIGFLAVLGGMESVVLADGRAGAAGRRARVPQGRPKITQRFIAGLRVGGPQVP